MTVRPPLTSRQAECLRVVTRSIAFRGYPPTLREIGDAMGIRSTNGINDHLKALERKGYLTREGLKSRTLVVLAETPLLDAVSHLGRRLAAAAPPGSARAELRLSPEAWSALRSEAGELLGAREQLEGLGRGRWCGVDLVLDEGRAPAPAEPGTKT